MPVAVSTAIANAQSASTLGMIIEAACSPDEGAGGGPAESWPSRSRITSIVPTTAR